MADKTEGGGFPSSHALTSSHCECRSSRLILVQKGCANEGGRCKRRASLRDRAAVIDGPCFVHRERRVGRRREWPVPQKCLLYGAGVRTCTISQSHGEPLEIWLPSSGHYFYATSRGTCPCSQRIRRPPETGPAHVHAQWLGIDPADPVADTWLQLQPTVSGGPRTRRAPPSCGRPVQERAVSRCRVSRLTCRRAITSRVFPDCTAMLLMVVVEAVLLVLAMARVRPPPAAGPAGQQHACCGAAAGNLHESELPGSQPLLSGRRQSETGPSRQI